jgi:acyltransferase
LLNIKGEIMENKVRSSNFELLRILALLMIILDHIVIHCMNGQLVGSQTILNQPMFFKRMQLLNIAMTFGYIGNNIFILISGYFLISKTDKSNLLKTASKLLSQQGFAATILVLLTASVQIIKKNSISWLLNIDIFNNMAWFVGFYFMIIVIAYLFLNRFLAKLDMNEYLIFLAVLFVFVEMGWTGEMIESIAIGLRVLLNGVFLFALGGFIHRFEPLRNIKVYIFFIVLLLSYGLIYISNYNTTNVNIANYIATGSQGVFQQSIATYANYHIGIELISIALFAIFMRLHIGSSKIVNFFGASTFMVYLTHDNTFFYAIWSRLNWIQILVNSPVKFVIAHIGMAILTFIFGVILYSLYLGLSKIIKENTRRIFFLQ